ncbi:Catalytic/ hydrolase [Zea mays]|uniref:Catalytic/ hydrolase n=1 Tax=Zea mays TaxID=4577 RepID=A0A1D6PDQ6_MAIZE|nr:Catalytic/ hydrolase [Zea mays]
MISCLGCSQICIVMYQPVVCKLPINIRSNKKKWSLLVRFLCSVI